MVTDNKRQLVWLETNDVIAVSGVGNITYKGLCLRFKQVLKVIFQIKINLFFIEFKIVNCIYYTRGYNKSMLKYPLRLQEVLNSSVENTSEITYFRNIILIFSNTFKKYYGENILLEHAQGFCDILTCIQIMCFFNYTRNFYLR